MLRIFPILAVGALLLVSISLTAAQGQEAGSGPDLSACAESTGQTRGECVAAAAHAHAAEQISNEIAQTALGLAASCADQIGADYGACVAAAAQDLVDKGQQGEAVASAAADLVQSCDGKEGMDFGRCVAEGAHALGEAGANQGGSTELVVQATSTAGPGQATQVPSRPEGVPAGPPSTVPVIQPGPPSTVPPADRGQPTTVPPVQPGPPTAPPVQPPRPTR
jgi:hypothetical protein